MFPKGPEPAFLSGARDGVVENECGCTSHCHACWQKDRYYLVDFWNTFNIKTIPQHIQSIARPRFSNEAYVIACEQALLFGQAKRASRVRASEGNLVPRVFPQKMGGAAPLIFWGKSPGDEVGARGRGKESLQPSLINFHFHPGNPGTPQSVKTVTVNVPHIRKVTTACQVSLDSRGRVSLLHSRF